MTSRPPRRPPCWCLAAALAVLPACGGEGDDDTFHADAWLQAHRGTVESLRARFDAAAALVKDLPATSGRVTAPAVPIVPITRQWGDGENAVMVSGVRVRGLPEFGADDGKSLEQGETSVSVAYTGYVDFASAYSLVDTGQPLYVDSKGAGEGLAKLLAKTRFALIAREVACRPGTLDTVAKTFTPGSYEGVVHVVDLQGPVHIGSVVFAATNTGSFESYSGSEAFMLNANLSHAAIRALHAEMAKVLPDIRMPQPEHR
jgi:hypothetical protein